MDLPINQFMTQAAHLFREGINPSRVDRQGKILVVALIALGCLAAFLYYAWYAKPKTISNQVTAQANSPKSVQTTAPQTASRRAFDANVILDASKKDNADPGAKTADDKKSDAKKGADTKTAPKGVVKKDDVYAPKTAVIILQQKKSGASPAPKSVVASAVANVHEDPELKKALLLSLQDMGPPQNLAIDAELSEDDDPEFQEALRLSQSDFNSLDKSGLGPANEDTDLNDVIQQSEEERQKKEDADLASALQLSQQGGAVKQPVKPLPKMPGAPKQVSAAPKGTPKGPGTPKQTPATPKVSVTPKRISLKLDGTPVDPNLVETTKAVSDQCSDTLELAVAKAKENKNIRIDKHEIKRNDAQNAYLVLHFASVAGRTRAVEEMRSLHKMFQSSEPTGGLGTNILEFTVDQTIEFQNKF